MRQTTQKGYKRIPEFFSIALSHDNLNNHYRMNSALNYYHKFSFEEMNEMIPFERQIYIMLLLEKLEEEKQRENKNE